MQETSVVQSPATSVQKSVRYRGAIWTLILLAPFLSEAREPWLRRRGLIVACVFFVLGCRIA